MIAIKNISRSSSFYRFVVVGTIGFLVDAGILSGLVYIFEWNPYSARIISFIFALQVTWIFNTKWTFQNRIARKKHHEFYLYAAIQSIGILINYGIYSWLLIMSDWLMSFPAASVATSSIIAMSFNYTALRYYIFKPRL